MPVFGNFKYCFDSIQNFWTRDFNSDFRGFLLPIFGGINCHLLPPHGRHLRGLFLLKIPQQKKKPLSTSVKSGILAPTDFRGGDLNSHTFIFSELDIISRNFLEKQKKKKKKKKNPKRKHKMQRSRNDSFRCDDLSRRRGCDVINFNFEKSNRIESNQIKSNQIKSKERMKEGRDDHWNGWRNGPSQMIRILQRSPSTWRWPLTLDSARVERPGPYAFIHYL